MKNNIIKINLYNNFRPSKNQILIQQINNNDNSSKISELNNNNDELILKKIYIRKNKKESQINTKLSSKDINSSEQIIDISTIPKTNSISYNINNSPQSFRYKYKNPYSFYSNWVNKNNIENKNFIKMNKSDGNINNKNFKNKNEYSKKNIKEKTDATCCLIF
jgi:hypothetical protein